MVISQWTAPAITAGDSFTYLVSIEEDGYSRPEGDAFTPGTIAAWRRDEWHFVAIVVTPVLHGQPLTVSSESLSAVVWGYFAGKQIGREDITRDYLPEMQRNAAVSAREWLVSIGVPADRIMSD